jgi:hypothetical protein
MGGNRLVSTNSVERIAGIANDSANRSTSWHGGKFDGSGRNVRVCLDHVAASENVNDSSGGLGGFK